VAFDPANKEHRRHYHNFAVNGTWGRCPVRFIVPDDQGNLVTLIQRKLVEYYVNREFVAEKQRFSVAQKRPKKVDKRSK
jgi:hypothetical protein